MSINDSERIEDPGLRSPDAGEPVRPPAQAVFHEVEDAADDAGDASAAKTPEATAGLESLFSDGFKQLSERLARAGECTAAYVREEPAKALLIAAATGVVLGAAVSLLCRPGESRSDA